MSIVILLLLGPLAIYLTLFGVCQLVLVLANALIPEPPDPVTARTRRFLVVVPAHNEQLILPRLLESLAKQDYVRGAWRTVVIADNCTDKTAAVARQAGADAVERTDATKKTKGYALSWFLAQTRLDDWDAVVILDADSVVNAGFVRQLNLQMERGDVVVQSFNGVANPGRSWFTRLMDVSESLANEALLPGRRKLGLSIHLLGNGMCFDTAVLKAHPWTAFSVGEDWEYCARLLQHDIAIGYTRHARQYHEESVDLGQASSQRVRWTSGRLHVLKAFGPALLSKGIRDGSARSFDACLQLVFPNASLGLNLTAVGFLGAVAHWALTGSLFMVGWFGVLGLVQLLLFVVGVLYTTDKRASAAALVMAPIFMVWKLGIDLMSMCGLGSKQWKPTERRIS